MIDLPFSTLERFGLPREEAALAFRSPDIRTLSFERGEVLIEPGAQTSHCLVLLEGFACRYKLTKQARRQIMSIHVRGDFCDLQALWLEMDYGVAALCEGAGALVPHEVLRSAIREHPRVAQALWRMTLVDGAVFREWLVVMGQRPAHVRVAHLLCELTAKVEAAGVALHPAAELPLGPEDLADALGLSFVHVNRVLQTLKAAGVVQRSDNGLLITRLEELRKVGEFDPAFLHLDDAAARETTAAS